MPLKIPSPPNPLARVCPMLTLAAPQTPPSALVGAEKSGLATVNCVGMRCGWFHPAAACAVLLAGDALLTQASVLVHAQEDEQDEQKGESAAAKA